MVLISVRLALVVSFLAFHPYDPGSNTTRGTFGVDCVFSPCLTARVFPWNFSPCLTASIPLVSMTTLLYSEYGLKKTLGTLGNCQRPVFSLGVFQRMHKITNL